MVSDAPSKRGDSWHSFDSAGSGGQLVRAVSRYAAEIVVIDIKSKFLVGDEDRALTSAAFCADALLPLKRLGVAVLVMDYSGNDGTKPRGSSVKRDDVDTVWRLMKRGRDGVFAERTHSRKSHVVDELSMVKRNGPLRHEPVHEQVHQAIWSR